MDASAGEIVPFWREAGETRWFARDHAFDREIVARFLVAHEAAVCGELTHLVADPAGALAVVLLLDQFPRNAFRGTSRAFASDPQARTVAAAAITAGHDRMIEEPLRAFFYLPFEHSEDLRDQDRAVALIEPLGEHYARHAREHRDIIRRFGRFPHRNLIVGRTSTPDEVAYLAQGGFEG